MSRPRRQHIEAPPVAKVPDWPPSLRLPGVQGVIAALQGLGSTPIPEGQHLAPLPSTPEERKAQGITYAAPALLAFFFGTTKDGRHLAAEVRVDGRKVVGLEPLCASRYPQESAKAWEMCAFARLCHGREYTATERAANLQQGKSVRLEDVADGQAVALSVRKGQTVALAMEIEGSTVLEPKALGTGNRLFAWQEAHAYAQRWFLPRRKVK